MAGVGAARPLKSSPNEILAKICLTNTRSVGYPVTSGEGPSMECLSKTRWTGAGEFGKEDIKLLYAGRKDEKQQGVGLMLRGNTIKALLGYNPTETSRHSSRHFAECCNCAGLCAKCNFYR